jgi:hypothetical protein
MTMHLFSSIEIVKKNVLAIIKIVPCGLICPGDFWPFSKKEKVITIIT